MINYTCADYRTEMILLSFRQRLQREDLSEEERNDIILQMKKLEAEMELD
ncbi:MAG: hypothetical protein JRD87_00825 [Deltaproteobacteria bacterium]|nr:hypothetical protein [Deltaproteobacteria bacterium]MBW2239889.1 hypothetical protein [Deltaproteobacteria bacterium]MBW2571228.1 hypothetical protein [Deltaproteobacteria bacterium]MBW2668426.1 hypothetical protein [Deltaproteobacteria bacterium]MBW2712000.1 hypothetical protein [Deltaproteobacteria bacterium]